VRIGASPRVIVRKNRGMERDWERAHEFFAMPPAAIEARLHAALPAARVTAARPLAAGLRNTNYRLEIEGGPSPLVLRLYVADPEACPREAAVLARVAGRVPAPRVVHSSPASNPPFALLCWLDGWPLDQVLRDCDDASALQLAAACGTALTAVHKTRFPAPGFFGPDATVVRPMPAWAPTVISTLDGPAGERLGPRLATKIRHAVESNAPMVEVAWSDAVLVHGDFKPWNLLARRRAGGWRLTGVLDWEFACAGSKLLDFATFLRDEAGRPPGFGAAFADAYRSAGGQLPEEWRGLTRLIDLLNLMQMLEWSGEQANEDIIRLTVGTLGAV